MTRSRRGATSVTFALCWVLSGCASSTTAAPTTEAPLVTTTASAPIEAPATTRSIPTDTSRPTPTPTDATSPTVTTLPGFEIVGERFEMNGAPINAGSPAEGLLLNSRMVQAVIDIELEDTPFRYPDTGIWDAERNTSELVAAMDSYAEHGLNAITVNLQGGNPLAAPVDNRPPWRVSAYDPDGGLSESWAGRLSQVLDAAETNNMVVIIGLFYFGQDHHLDGETAITNAVDGVVDWILAGGHRNVMVEICNECNVHYDHDVLQPDRVVELIRRVQDRSNGSIPVSASFTGGRMPPDDVIESADFILVHGNRQEPEDITALVRRIRRHPLYLADPKPIVFNEDSTDLANMIAAVEAGAGWGYHDKGENDYRNGFQAPPVNWTINTAEKRAFFDLTRQLSTPAP